jgi:hypothetical protein
MNHCVLVGIIACKLIFKVTVLQFVLTFQASGCSLCSVECMKYLKHFYWLFV